MEKDARAPARGSRATCLSLCLTLSLSAGVVSAEGASAEAPEPADGIAAMLEGGLAELAAEALERNPSLAAAAARARAAGQRVPQARALPDPMLGVTGFVAPPETRVGPQRFSATLSQRLPWFGKLSLRERASLRRAEALAHQLEARRLELLTELRRLYQEIAFLDAQRILLETDRATLVHFEELARARYASGLGAEQGVVKIQAEITRDDTRLLDLAARRAALVAALNALCDRPSDSPLPRLAEPAPSPVALPALEILRRHALAARPELASADAEVARADALVALARKEPKPDLTLGLTYTAVGKRGDPAGRLQRPPDDGSDVFGISASLNLPIRRGRLKAAVAEAAEARRAAAETRREVAASIDRALGDLAARVRLSAEQLRLFERVLLIQAEQALRSAESGYAAGGLDSLDLLDAERTLLDVRIGAARARADHAIALARLEGALGVPLVSEMEGALP